MKINYKGVSVHYDIFGKGESVVLLHGFLENRSMWKDLIPNLSKHNRIISIDLLGHGQTDCIGYIHTMELMAKAVEAVLNHLEINTSTFIGHSMGGYVALAYAELFPEKLKGLCLMNSTALPDDEERKQNRDRAVLAVKQNHRAFISMSVSNLFAVDNREILKEEIEHVKQQALKTPLQGIIAALEGMKIRKNREFIVKNASYKMMMVIGQKDPVLDYNEMISQAESADIELVEFPDGHMSHIENKKELAYKFMHFIEN